MSKLDKYKEYTDMNQFPVIKEVSSYCHNYHIGLDGDLLFASSDDDNTTEWWVICGDMAPDYLGESYVSEGDNLHRFKKRQT